MVLHSSGLLDHKLFCAKYCDCSAQMMCFTALSNLMSLNVSSDENIIAVGVGLRRQICEVLLSQGFVFIRGVCLACVLCLAFRCIEKLLQQSCEGQSKTEANVNLMAF